MYCISCSANLLTFIPEGEQLLLPMIINKLGDPVSKVSAKTLHELTKIGYKHSNMCEVLIIETQKFIFRNNVSDRAQRYGLCYLANLSKITGEKESIRMVNICFAFFKQMVNKGAVNSHIMQSILYCLQKSISRIRRIEKHVNDNILDKETEDTIYRLAHLSDIQISIQAYGLLLQLATKHDNVTNCRFFNALYRKTMDMDLYFAGSKTVSHFLHIVLKAMYIDVNITRIKAFIKRLLQTSIYAPSNVTAGILVIIDRLLYMRTDLDIVFKPVKLTNGKRDELVNEHQCTQNFQQYDPFHRVPMHSGAKSTGLDDIGVILRSFHPSIRIFINEISTSK